MPAGATAQRQRARPRPPLQPLSLLEAELEGAAVKNSLKIRCVDENYLRRKSQSELLPRRHHKGQTRVVLHCSEPIDYAPPAGAQWELWA